MKTLTLYSAKISPEICNAVLGAVWRKDRKSSEQPPITPDDLKPHEPVQVIHDRVGGFKLDMIRKMPIPLVKRKFGVKTPIYGTPDLDQELNEVRKEIDNLDATVEAIEEHHALLWKRYKTLLNARVFFTFGVFLIEDFAERIEAIHQNWGIVRQAGVNMPHPLAPIVREWLIDKTAKPITREYDQRHPVAILRSGSLGSIRNVVLDMEGTGQSPVIISDVESPNESQLTLFPEENNSILPAILPYHRLWDGRTPTRTRSGAVSHGERIADEAFFPLEQGDINAHLKFDLGMLLRALNPDLTEAQLSSNRGKYLHYLIHGLHEVQYLGWQYERGDGERGLWVPVKMPDHFMPTIQSSDDFAVRLTVSLLETDSYNGMAIEKYPLRLTGKKSISQRNALRTACWIFDRFGTKKRGITHPTRPIVHRDADGYLLTSEGTRAFDSRGKPITNPYHAMAIKQLDREPSPIRTKYKKLPFDDLVRACFPQGYPQGERAKYLKRSLAAWEALEKKGFIRIMDKSSEGWRIVPSDRHLRAYRGLKKATQKTQDSS